MLVNVAPKWTKSPKDVECVAGQSIVIDCQAEAHPSPRVWWEIGLYSATPGGPGNQPTDQQLKGAAVQSSVSSQLDLPVAQSTAPLVSSAPSSSASLSALAGAHNGQQQFPMSPNHYKTIISNSRIHILENASLVIRDVIRSDAGYYLCQAANNFGSLSALIKLTVNVGASFTNKYLIKYVKLNERVEFDCDPVGQSPVDITWYMHQVATNSAEPSINLLAAPSGLTGPFGGAARTGSGESQAANQSLPVSEHLQQQQRASSGFHYGRRLFMATIRTELSQQLGGQQQQQHQHQQPTASGGKSTLSGGSQADVGPAEPTSSMSFELLRRPEPSQSELVRLIIQQAKRQHSAEYTCLASNRFGSDEKLVRLLVQEPPDWIHDISLVQADSRSVALAWLAPFNGNSPITSYIVEWSKRQRGPGTGTDAGAGPAGGLAATSGSAQTSGSRWSQMIVQQPAAKLANLEPQSSYEVRVRAQNAIGLSGGAQAGVGQLLVTTTEEAPNAPPADVRAVALSSSTLQLSWLMSGQPEASAGPQLDSPTMPTGSGSTPNQRQPKFSVKGYYVGYKVTNSNESYVFKTVSLEEASGLGGVGYTGSGGFDANFNHNSNNYNNRSGSTQKGTQNRLRVLIDELKRATKYTIIVQAFNSAGSGPQSDAVEARTLASDPPPAPALRAGLATYSSVELHWQLPWPETSWRPGEAQPEVEPTVDGFHLFYRAGEGAWQERSLSPASHSLVVSSATSSAGPLVSLVSGTLGSQIASGSAEGSTGSASSWPRNLTSASSRIVFRLNLDQLNCGTAYQVYLLAYNRIGSGPASQLIQARTRGLAPIAPRRQDYLTVNSTWLQVNLDAWMDGGCGILNFQLRYRPLIGGRPSGVLATATSNPEVDAAWRASLDNQQHWILIASNVSLEQRTLELRDLQPEAWYVLQTVAESSAGKTEVQHTFMTLDKLGRVPLEALELTEGSQGGLPALFRNNVSLRSILHNISGANGAAGFVSPLAVGIGFCLLLLATCSLFLARKFNQTLKDNQSFDSESAHHHHGHHHHHQHHVNHHLGAHSQHNQLDGMSSNDYRRVASDYSSASIIVNNNDNNTDKSSSVAGQAADQSPPPTSRLYGMISHEMGGGNSCSLKVSPCKTTSTSLATGSSSANSNSNNEPSIMGLVSEANNQSNLNDEQNIHETHLSCMTDMDNSTLPGGKFAQTGSGHEYCCDSPSLARFGSAGATTLARDSNSMEFSNLNNGSHMQQFRAFKTMPYPHNRPMSTFISRNMSGTQAATPTGSCLTNQQQQGHYAMRFMPNGPHEVFKNNDTSVNQQLDECHHQQPHQHLVSDAQQIYSKLRLIYNSNANYNSLCRDIASKTNSGVNPAEHSADCQQQSAFNGDTINLAILAQQSQKSLACTLKRAAAAAAVAAASGTPINGPQQQNLYLAENGCDLSGRVHEVSPNELADLLLSAHHQQQQQSSMMDTANSGNYDPRYQQQQQQMMSNANNKCLHGTGSGFSEPYGASGSSSNSTGNNIDSSQATNSPLLDTASQQLINLSSNNNHYKSSCGQQQQSQPQSMQPNNEQSDYALPFPPKWV